MVVSVPAIRSLPSMWLSQLLGLSEAVTHESRGKQAPRSTGQRTLLQHNHHLGVRGKFWVQELTSYLTFNRVRFGPWNLNITGKFTEILGEMVGGPHHHGAPW